MKKTNLRIKNTFIIEEKKDYYLSSIDDYEEWRDIDEKDLEKYKEEKITEQLISLMKKYDIYSNVNFFDINDKKKTVTLSQKGGWSHKPKNTELSGGGWNVSPQRGGEWGLKKIFE